jgi:hypothetical protein
MFRCTSDSRLDRGRHDGRRESGVSARSVDDFGYAKLLVIIFALFGARSRCGWRTPGEAHQPPGSNQIPNGSEKVSTTSPNTHKILLSTPALGTKTSERIF